MSAPILYIVLLNICIFDKLSVCETKRGVPGLSEVSSVQLWYFKQVFVDKGF